ncbi:MAG: hypothetical protein ACQEP2_01380 [Actinomycetota bacterium]
MAKTKVSIMHNFSNSGMIEILLEIFWKTIIVPAVKPNNTPANLLFAFLDIIISRACRDMRETKIIIK